MISVYIHWLITQLLNFWVPLVASIFQGPLFWALLSRLIWLSSVGFYFSVQVSESVRASERSTLISSSPIASSISQQQIVVREPKVSLVNYQAILRGNPFQEPPRALILRRLREDQLPEGLQEKIDKCLDQLARRPEQAQTILENLYEEFAREPRTKAVKQAMGLILARMRLHAKTHELESWKISIENRIAFLEYPKTQSGWKKSLISDEIHARLQVMQQEKGLEDLEIFINGESFTQAHEIPLNFEGQWLFVSSSFRPKIVEGTWPKASEALSQPWSTWLSGTCARPSHQDPILALSGKVIGVYAPMCEVVLQDSFQMGLKPFSFHRIPDNKAWYQNPYWVSALVLGTGLLILRSQNQHLRVSF